MRGCPQCGSMAYESRLVTVDPYREAARNARLLRDLGDYDAAVDLLTRLAAVKIVNFMRGDRPYLCLTCGSQFDDG